MLLGVFAEPQLKLPRRGRQLHKCRVRANPDLPESLYDALQVGVVLLGGGKVANLGGLWNVSLFSYVFDARNYIARGSQLRGSLFRDSTLTLVGYLYIDERRKL